jgi:hypothetical protein
MGNQYEDTSTTNNTQVAYLVLITPTTTKMRARRVCIHLHWNFAYN